MAKVVEALEDIEWRLLDDIAVSFGKAHAQSLANLFRQGELFETNDLKSVFIRRLREDFPGRMVVPAKMFENFRYLAGVAASGLSDEEIEAAKGSRMWDRLENEVHADVISDDSYDLFTRTYIVTEGQAAKVFSRDYYETATDRLCGFDLLYKDDDFEEGEQ